MTTDTFVHADIFKRLMLSWISFSEHSEAVDTVNLLNGATLGGLCLFFHERNVIAHQSNVVTGRTIRVELDWGFSEGRQYGRGKKGGQIRDELRPHEDKARGSVMVRDSDTIESSIQFTYRKGGKFGSRRVGGGRVDGRPHGNRKWQNRADRFRSSGVYALYYFSVLL